MATTPKGIYYPNNYNEIADIPEDMKKMAESIEEVFENTDSDLSGIKEEQTTQNNRLNSLEVDNTTNKSDILTNKQEINNIKTEQTEQNTNISTNATNIESLQEENENLKKIVSQLPQVPGQGTEVTLENTIEAPFTEFDVEGNSTQDGTPSPDNEVPILSAGDNGSINEKIINKNFATNITGNVTRNGLTFKVNDDKSITINGTATAQTFYNLRTDLNFKTGETWTLSGCKGGSSSTYGFYCYNLGDLYDGVRTKTFTESYTNRTLGIVIQNGYTANNLTFYPQLELNSQATDYVPPQEQDYSIFVQQPFRSNKDKTIRDCFVKKSDNKKYERHFINEITLDGTENWSRSDTEGFIRYVVTFANMKSVGATRSANILCNKFKGSIENGYGNCFAFNNTVAFYVPENIENFSDWKNWLEENNVKLQYELETPLELPCTETQIQQLENLPSTYKDFTTINSEDETPAYLEVAGIYDMNKLITRVEVLESES